MPRIVTVSTKAWVRRVILQPLQGVHAARKISARKIPRNSSSCSVIDISALSLSILRYLTLASIFDLKCIIIYLSLLGFIQFNRGGFFSCLDYYFYQFRFLGFFCWYGSYAMKNLCVLLILGHASSFRLFLFFLFMKSCSVNLFSRGLNYPDCPNTHTHTHTHTHTYCLRRQLKIYSFLEYDEKHIVIVLFYKKVYYHHYVIGYSLENLIASS